MVGVDPRSGEMAGGDLTSQAEQTFKNIGEVLEEAMQIPASGPIGLEGDRGQMEYRRIRIREL